MEDHSRPHELSFSWDRTGYSSRPSRPAPQHLGRASPTRRSRGRLAPRRTTAPGRGRGSRKWPRIVTRVLLCRAWPPSSLGSTDLAYSPAIPVRFFAWIRRPHSARSLHEQGRSSSAFVAAILRASSSSSLILRCASTCHRWEGGVSPRKPKNSCLASASVKPQALARSNTASRSKTDES